MHTTIKVFGGLKALAGTDQVTLELPERATVAALLAEFPWVDEDTPLVVAVNHEYADRSTVIHPGDEVALIPPVSGGAPATGAPPAVWDPPHTSSHSVAIRDRELGVDSATQPRLDSANGSPARVGLLLCRQPRSR